MFAGGEGDALQVGVRYGLAVERYAALIAQEPEYALHQRGLAGTVFAEEAHELPAGQGQAHVVQCELGVIFLADVFYLKHFNAP